MVLETLRYKFCIFNRFHFQGGNVYTNDMNSIGIQVIVSKPVE